MQMDKRETPTVHRDGRTVETKLLAITQRAKENPKERFTSLIHLINEDFLEKCFKELKRDKASGVDGVSVDEYGVNLAKNIKNLIDRMKAWQYIPQPVKRVYIPKTNGKERPLGIPAVEDKIVQMAIKKILEAIYEVDFSNVSYGFRPKLSCHDALDAVDKAIMSNPVNYIVDVDIEKFFDTVDHSWLMKFLGHRIADSNLLRLIGRFLKAGVIEEGNYYQTEKGTPQGGIISPVLANVYLHYVLDLWFEKEVKKEAKGYVQLIRYADDYVVCFQAEKEAEAFKQALEERLAKFGLKLSTEKSKIIKFGRYQWEKAKEEGKKLETFDFLGFTHYCDKTRKGKFKVGRKTSQSKFKHKTKELNQWLKKARNQVKMQEMWKTLKQKLRGHYQYYGMSGNMRGIEAYYKETIKLAHKWINRRSQKKSYNWQQFLKYIKYNPLPQPKIYHLTYTLSSI